MTNSHKDQIENRGKDGYGKSIGYIPPRIGENSIRATCGLETLNMSRKWYIKCIYVCRYVWEKKSNTKTVMSVINYDHFDDDYGDSVIHSVSKSHSQSVNQSFCHHSITNSESKYRVVQSIKIIQLTWKIVKALTNIIEMSCVENLRSKSEIQVKLKQIFHQTTASGCHLNHLLIQMVPARGSKT